jgi:hypothetical protein
MHEDDRQPRPTLKVLTRLTNASEAAMVISELEAAGIRAMRLPGRLHDIYVEEHNLARAHEVLSTPMSERDLTEAEEAAAATLPAWHPPRGPADEPRLIPEPSRSPTRERHLWKRVLKRAAKQLRDPFGRPLPERTDR